MCTSINTADGTWNMPATMSLPRRQVASIETHGSEPSSLSPKASGLVLSVTLSRVSQPVYNIEVHGEHVYQDGEMGVVVHNVSSISGLASKLTREASDRLRENARNTWQMLTGRRAFWDDLEVHHRIPLEWSHIFGKADPNRVSNLVGINGKIHKQVSEAWAAWKRSLGERTPTQAEIMEQAFKIDELFKNHWLFPK